MTLPSSRPSVLFVCVHNAGRSQMGAAFLTHLGRGRVEVRSAGSAPADTVNGAVVEAMAEVGTDISAETQKVLTVEAVQASDVVITMGCGDACPYFPGKRYLTGPSTTPPDRASQPSAPSVTRSSGASADCWTSSGSPSPDDRSRQAALRSLQTVRLTGSRPDSKESQPYVRPLKWSRSRCWSAWRTGLGCLSIMSRFTAVAAYCADSPTAAAITYPFRASMLDTAPES